MLKATTPKQHLSTSLGFFRQEMFCVFFTFYNTPNIPLFSSFFLHIILALLHSLANFPFVAFAVVTPLDCGVEVGGGFVVRVGEHGDYGEDDLLDSDDGAPALWGGVGWGGGRGGGGGG